MTKFTPARESVDGYRKLRPHISGNIVTNREYGTRLGLRAGPAGTIFPHAASATFRNLIAFFS
jgi:hypothetical protein